MALIVINKAASRGQIREQIRQLRRIADALELVAERLIVPETLTQEITFTDIEKPEHIDRQREREKASQFIHGESM